MSSQCDTQQEAHPPARVALQMAGLPPAPSAARSPPPNHPLAAQISGVATSPSPRLHLRRRWHADPCSIFESGVQAGRPGSSLRRNANEQLPPFPPSGPWSLLSSNPGPLHSQWWRLQPAVKFKAERGGLGGKRPLPAAQRGWAPTGVATHDLQREESGAHKTQTLTVGLGDLNLPFPSPPEEPSVYSPFRKP